MMKLLILFMFSLFTSAAIAQQTLRSVKVNELRTIMDTTQGPLIINFWATWCGPCIREIPWFESAVNESVTPVKLILVSLDFPEDYPAKLSAFIKKKMYKSEVLFLNEAKADDFIPVIDAKWTGAIPASIFINNSKKYYQLFNHQIPEPRFKLELEILVE